MFLWRTGISARTLLCTHTKCHATLDEAALVTIALPDQGVRLVRLVPASLGESFIPPRFVVIFVDWMKASLNAAQRQIVAPLVSRAMTHPLHLKRFWDPS